MMPPALSERVLYEDNHLIVVNKACGEISQGDKSGDPSLGEAVAELIRLRDAKPGRAFLGLVHRLDRPTSGAMVFAKTSKALSRLNEGFRERGAGKAYWAVVEGGPADDGGALRHWLGRDEKRNKAFASDRPGPGLVEASLDWRLVRRGDRYSLLEIDLHTGRHHQIRAQLAAVGLVIKGDLKYGAARSNADGGICLHALRLSFDHPVAAADGARRVEVTADPRPVQGDPIWRHLLPPEVVFGARLGAPGVAF